jgi:hypothetical protein
MHWFGGDPVAQKFNNHLTADNWREQKNTLSSCLERML